RASALVYETGYGADSHRHSLLDRTGGIESLRTVIVLPPLAPDTAVGPLFPELGSGVPADCGPQRTDPNTVVYLAFTSGTTGVPKG
ncbi:hypothetical protein CH340_25740, partial [Rhodoplanes serenus]